MSHGVDAFMSPSIVSLTQRAQAVACSGAYVPGGHVIQGTEVLGEYEPALHPMHADHA